ncbi:MAG: double zinc ribbon domain-containing protein [Syntrophobacteraceae bacterium]
MQPEKPVQFISIIKAGLRLAGFSFLDLCLPGVCAGCGKIENHSEKSWCPDCLNQIAWIASPICPQCGRPYPDAPGSSDHLCGECLQEAFRFDTARSAVFHSGIVRDRVHQFKFGARMEWVPPLVELLEMTYSRSTMPVPDLVVPVPLHSKRLKERGFNQSGLLGKELSRKLGLAVSFDTLRRKKWTDPQTRMNRQERLNNVKGVFELSKDAAVRGRRILLLDDVFTTGSTLSECARTLKKKGASEVHALTVTRAMPD